MEQTLFVVTQKASSETFVIDKMSVTGSAGSRGEVTAVIAWWGGFSDQCNGFTMEAMKEKAWPIEVQGLGAQRKVERESMRVFLSF